jgi:hypothetical protein
MDERLRHAEQPLLLERLVVALIAFLSRQSDAAGPASREPHKERPGMRGDSKALFGV